MIVARIELWPRGHPRAIESIAVVMITNVGPAPRGRHRYDVRCGGVCASVTHHRDDGAQLLLEQALRALRISGRSAGI